MKMGMSQIYGTAYVEFDNEASAAKALAATNGKKVGNYTLKVSYYQKQPKFVPQTFMQTSAAPFSGPTQHGRDYRVLFIRKMNRRVRNALIKIAGGRSTTRVNLQETWQGLELSDQAYAKPPVAWQGLRYLQYRR